MKQPVYMLSVEVRDHLLAVLERAERAITWEAQHRRLEETYPQAEKLYDLADDVAEAVDMLGRATLVFPGASNVVPFPTRGGVA